MIGIRTQALMVASPALYHWVIVNKNLVFKQPKNYHRQRTNEKTRRKGVILGGPEAPVCVRAWIYVCVNICMCVCMYICMYVYMYVCARAPVHVWCDLVLRQVIGPTTCRRARSPGYSPIESYGIIHCNALLNCINYWLGMTVYQGNVMSTSRPYAVFLV